MTSEPSASSMSDVWPDSQFECPKVLLSVALEEEQWLSPQQWSDWMRSIPALVKHAHVEGVYKSHSTLLLLSVSIAIWNLIPANPAILFVGFSKSNNLVDVQSSQEDPTSKAIRTNMTTQPTIISANEKTTKGTIDSPKNMSGWLKDNNAELEQTRRELQISKDEALRAWEELSVREQSERDIVVSLRKGEPASVGGIQVVPLVQHRKMTNEERPSPELQKRRMIEDDKYPSPEQAFLPVNSMSDTKSIPSLSSIPSPVQSVEDIRTELAHPFGRSDSGLMQSDEDTKVHKSENSKEDVMSAALRVADFALDRDVKREWISAVAQYAEACESLEGLLQQALREHQRSAVEWIVSSKICMLT